jgi:hypothetical protein
MFGRKFANEVSKDFSHRFFQFTSETIKIVKNINLGNRVGKKMSRSRLTLLLLKFPHAIPVVGRTAIEEQSNAF